MRGTLGVQERRLTTIDRKTWLRQLLPLALLLAVMVAVLALFVLALWDRNSHIGSSRATIVSESATSLLAQVAKRYSAAKSYQDAGSSVLFFEDGVREVTRHNFKTLFVRDGRLRFESTCVSTVFGTTRSVVWSDGSISKMRWKRPSDPEPKSDTKEVVDWATILAAASSGGLEFSPAVLLVGGLLNRIDGQRRVVGVSSLRSVREEVLEGRQTWVVAGTDENGRETRVFVDKASYAVVCIEVTQKGDSEKLHERTVYLPAFDVDVKDSELSDGWDSP